MYRVFVAPAGGICITPMISAFCLICGYNLKLCQAQSLGERGETSKLYNYLTIPQNLQRITVDSDKFHPLVFPWDAIATFTLTTQGGAR
jgi:hypothetical protein